MEKSGRFKFSYLKAICQRPGIQCPGAPGHRAAPGFLCAAQEPSKIQGGGGKGKVVGEAWLSFPAFQLPSAFCKLNSQRVRDE